nr:MAG: hypothetical protein [Penaeus monodon endogenous nimavirus]
MNSKHHNSLSGTIFSIVANQRKDSGSFAVWTKGLINFNNVLARQLNGNTESNTFVAKVKGFTSEPHSSHEKDTEIMDRKTTSSLVRLKNRVRDIPREEEGIPKSKYKLLSIANIVSAVNNTVNILTDIGFFYIDIISRVLRKTFEYFPRHLPTLALTPDTRDFQDDRNYDVSDDIAFISSGDGMVVNTCAVRYYCPIVYRSKMSSDHNSLIIQMKMGDGTLHWIIMPNTPSGKKDLIDLVDVIKWSTIHNTFEEAKMANVHIPKFSIEGVYKPLMVRNEQEWDCNYSKPHKPKIADRTSQDIVIDRPFIFVNCDYDGTIQEMGIFLGPVKA